MALVSNQGIVPTFFYLVIRNLVGFYFLNSGRWFCFQEHIWCLSAGLAYDRLKKVSPRHLDKSHSNYRQGGREGPSIGSYPLGHEFDALAKKLISLADEDRSLGLLAFWEDWVEKSFGGVTRWPSNTENSYSALMICIIALGPPKPSQFLLFAICYYSCPSVLCNFLPTHPLNPSLELIQQLLH